MPNENLIPTTNGKPALPETAELTPAAPVVLHSLEAPAATAWQRTKAAGLAFVLAHWKQFALWVAALTGAAVYNAANGPGPEGDVPLPPPPPFVWPDDPFGWSPPTDEAVRQVIRDGRTFDRTEAFRETFWTEDADLPAWRFYKKVTGLDFAHDQGGIGSCVSFGFGGATDMSLAANIALRRGQPQAWDRTSREVIYGGGRINIKRFDVPSEGMMGKWAAEWLEKAGAVGIGQGTPPVGPYSVDRCREWGRRGVPESVVALGKANPVKTALVRTPEEVRSALANGYFVAIASSVGFGNLNGPPLQRDADGFLRRSGSWPHCMFVAGYRKDKKGFLIVNSWVKGWIAGPKGFGDEPDGSFWCRWEDMAAIVAGSGSMEPPDSYAISSVGGFRRRLVEPSDWLISNRDNDLRPGPAFGSTPLAFGWIGGGR